MTHSKTEVKDTKIKTRERCGLCIYRSLHPLCWLTGKKVEDDNDACEHFGLSSTIHDGEFITPDQAENVRRALYGN